MTPSTRTTLGLALLLLASVAGAQPAPPAPADPQEPATTTPPSTPADKPAPDQATLDKEFARKLSGATLDGFFTVDGNDKPPGREKYTLVKVSKLRGEHWLFNARIQFGGKDVTVPLMLPVKWAGDTAVITVTDLGIPGLGTYTARVLIYRDGYAGTWSGGDHGGHLWGKIVRAEAGKESGAN